MLEVIEVSKSYKKKRVLDGVSISLNRGEIVGILGPNGAGKTTLFKIIIGLLTPDSGRVVLDGERIDGRPLHHMIKKGVGYLPQEPSLFTGLTVYENLKVAGGDREDQIERVIEAMRLMDLKERTCENLSGGEKRKVEIARSLLLNPSYMLFDEPFSQIDPRTVYELIEIIKKMRVDKIGVLITDHSAREVFGICDRIYIIAEGKVVTQGSPDELKKDKLVRDIYLGQLFEM